MLTQYYPPEIGATQTRLHFFAADLASRGHDVAVICEIPNHPQGIVHNGFRRRPTIRRCLEGVDVTYVWVWARPVRTPANRLLSYTTYAAGAILAGAIGATRPDVVFASSPPLPVAVAGEVLARRFRVPWVMDVRDLWPAAGVAMGELSEGRLLRMASAAERFLYRRASAITVVTEPFRTQIAAETTASKISLVPNGTTQFWLDAQRTEAPDRSTLDMLADEFVWTFAGNVGKAQGLRVALEAAEMLGAGYRLLVLGDGPEVAPLKTQADSLTRGIVDFRPQVPPAIARDYLRASDALLVSLAADPIFDDFVPSKVWDFAAVGRPVILAVAGEAARLTASGEAALCVPPGDPGALARAVRTLNDRADLGARLSRNGVRLAADNLRARHSRTLESVLSRVVSG